MPFNSYTFIFSFLPITLCGYFLCNRLFGKKIGNVFLALASLVFYYSAGIECVMILAVSVLVNFIASLLIRKTKAKKAALTVGIIFNILLLLYFKYCNFFVDNLNQFFGKEIEIEKILLPLGISFFTFQQIAYLVNVFKHKLQHVTFLEYALFILYFPKLIMGPLIEPEDFLQQIRDDSLKKFNTDHFIKGLQIFSIGLFKKLLLADVFARAASWGISNWESLSSLDLILAMLAYTFQIYFDFSGYTDMALGVSNMFNIQLPFNFDSPYQAYSLRDFWKRWHMSLTNFLTRYIYFPLGGNRKGVARTYINMLIVFLVSGIWHGANWTFLLWGFLNGAICVLERIFNKEIKKLHSGFRWLFTFAMVNVLWLLFSADSVVQWLEILKHILKFSSTTVSPDFINCFVLPEYSTLCSLSAWFAHLDEVIIGLPMLLFFFVAGLFAFCFTNTNKREYKLNFRTALVTACTLVAGLFALGTESTFVYFGF